MDKVVSIGGVTTVSEPANALLEKAKLWELDDVLIIGFDAEGKLAFGGNMSSNPEILWLLVQAQKWLMDEYGD